MWTIKNPTGFTLQFVPVQEKRAIIGSYIVEYKHPPRNCAEDPR